MKKAIETVMWGGLALALVVAPEAASGGTEAAIVLDADDASYEFTGECRLIRSRGATTPNGGDVRGLGTGPGGEPLAITLSHSPSSQDGDPPVVVLSVRRAPEGDYADYQEASGAILEARDLTSIVLNGNELDGGVDGATMWAAGEATYHEWGDGLESTTTDVRVEVNVRGCGTDRP